MTEKLPSQKGDDLEKDASQEKKLNFEISGVKAKTMMVLGMLSAAAPAVAKSADPKEKTIMVSDAPSNDEDSQWKEWSAKDAKRFMAEEVKRYTPTNADATHTALSLEKINELSDIIPIGAPEVFDDERTEPWKREIMRNHILKMEGGGNYSFFGAEVNGEKKLFAQMASHVDSSPVGSEVWVGGDLFGFQTNGGGVFLGE